MDSPCVEKVTANLIEGRGNLTQLMKLLENRPSNIDNTDHEILNLTAGISRSFDKSIQMLNSGGKRSGLGSIETSSKRPGTRDRRGCYKRRISDSWNLSPTMEDGYAWRKYGQKFINSHNFPRSYFRCTHKKEGCKAKKQVHKWEQDPSLYRTTYFGKHTCSNTTKSSQLPSIVEVDVSPIDDPYVVNFDSTPTPISVDEIMDNLSYQDKSSTGVIKVGDNEIPELIDATMWSDFVTIESCDKDESVSSIYNYDIDIDGGLCGSFEPENIYFYF